MTLECKAVPIITEMNLQNSQAPLPGMLPHVVTCKSRIAKRELRTGNQTKILKIQGRLLCSVPFPSVLNFPPDLNQ